MSLIVNILYTGQGDSARRFAREMTDSGLVAQIRAEAGNEGYAYYFPMEDEESVLLIDAWRDQAALDGHYCSELMSKIAALREKFRLRMRVTRYEPLP